MRNRELLRRRGVELLEKGWKQTKIAEALGVSQSAVSKWKIRLKKEGKAMLRDKPLPGAPRQMTTEQEQELIQILKRGAKSYGFEGDFWNYKRIKRVLSETFSIELSVRQSGRILKRLGFSRQKPQLKSYQQDPAKVQEWKEQILPDLKKKPGKKKL
jgi:transposase